jgi:hypothetical protein
MPPTPCECPTSYCEYDEDTVDVIAGGKTIADAERRAKEKAKKEARREADQALADAEARGDACKKPCIAWFRIEIGEPDAQEYPYHSRKRQFAFGWCDWKLLVKCELPEKAARKKEKNKKPKGKLH